MAVDKKLNGGIVPDALVETAAKGSGALIAGGRNPAAAGRAGANSIGWPDGSGGDGGTRTPDLCIANAALSQLSYIPSASSELRRV